MQSATRSVDKKNLQSIRKQNAKIQKNPKKQLQTSASRGSYINNVKKKRKSNKNY